MLAGLSFSGMVLATPVSVVNTSYYSMITGSAGGVMDYSNPNGWLDVIYNGDNYSTIYVVGNSYQGSAFYCFVNPTDPGFEQMSKAASGITSNSHVTAMRYSNSLCSQLTIRN